MDVSDEDEPVRKRHRESIIEEKNNLREENDSLRCQMEAYKNEVSASVELYFILFMQYYLYTRCPSF